MVLPPDWSPEIAEAKGASTVERLEQLTLAEFIASGAYDRHVRAMRLRYRRRRDQLVATLASTRPTSRSRAWPPGCRR